jgi:PmbA protein
MADTGLTGITDLLKRGLDRAIKKGATAARIAYSRRGAIACEFENARLKTTDTQRSFGYSIDVIAGGLKGSTSGNDPADLDDLIDRAVALSAVGSVAHFSRYPAPGKTVGVRTHSPRTLELTRDRMIGECAKIVDALKARDPGMFISASGGRSESEGLLVTTGGVSHSWRSTGWSLGGYVQRIRGTDMVNAGEWRWWGDLNEYYDPGFISDKILTDLNRCDKIVDAPSGLVPVILPPGRVEMILNPVLMGVSGRNVAKGDSPLKGKLGEKLFDPALTMVDDPHIDFSGGADEMDSNGVPTTKFEIVRDGVLKAFLYDLDSAGLAGTAPTGHDGCWPHMLIVPPGAKSKADLFAGVRDGLYVKDILGFGQSNMMNGDVSGNVSLGFRIKNGEIVGRVKDTMIAGNVYELLKQGVEFSRDTDPISRMPYMKLSGVSVSSAKKNS